MLEILCGGIADRPVLMLEILCGGIADRPVLMLEILCGGIADRPVLMLEILCGGIADRPVLMLEILNKHIKCKAKNNYYIITNDCQIMNVKIKSLQKIHHAAKR